MYLVENQEESKNMKKIVFKDLIFNKKAELIFISVSKSSFLKPFKGFNMSRYVQE